jgi:hypothetical protein
MYSLNEVDAAAKRAARGIGVPWGIAEEAGKAVRWLTAAGLPGAQALAALLTRLDGRPYRGFCPTAGLGLWAAGSGVLCPLATGASLADAATVLSTQRGNETGNETGSQTGTQWGIDLGRTAHPLLLIPFASSAARQTATGVALSWDDVTVTLGADGAIIEITGTALETAVAETVHCRAISVDRASGIAVHRSAIPGPVWDRLQALGRRTFAPDTEVSRVAGAGSDLSDNE